MALTTIPDSHQDLLLNPVVVTLVTLMPDGQPQATPVWVDWDGAHVIVNTARGRQKDRNMKSGRPVALCAIDPGNPHRWMEVRGVVVEDDEASGVAVIDRLAKKYKGVDSYFGGFRSAEDRYKQVRVTYKIRPTRVNVGG